MLLWEDKMNFRESIGAPKIFLLVLAGLLSIQVSASESTQTHSALIVIDMQKKLLTPGKWQHVSPVMIDSLIKSVNCTIYKAKSQSVPIIYIVNEWTNPIINFFSKIVCKKGTEGAKLDDRIFCDSVHIFSKSKPSAFTNIEFCEWITDNHIDTLFITGVMAQGCVLQTIKSALKQELVVFTIKNAIGSTSVSTLQKYLQKYEDLGVEVNDSF
jgi:nicotinamidase-related amidase